MLSSIPLAIVGFIVAVGVLVTVHEFGHFWVARRAGVRVLCFSIGFGPALWQRTAADGTEYRIAMIPLGGYVRMLDESEGEVPAAERDRAFNRQPLARRTAVVLAGPAANFLFAVVAYFLILVLGVTAVRPLVGDITPGSAADSAGLQHGDLIRQVNGRGVDTWQQAGLALVDAAVQQRSARIQVESEDGGLRSLSLDMRALGRLDDAENMLPDLGIAPYRPKLDAVLGELLPEGPAQSAGLAPGERIVALDGVPVDGWEDLVERVRARPDETVLLAVEGTDGRRDVRVTLDSRQHVDEVIGYLGVTPEVPEELYERLYVTDRQGVLAAIPGAVVRTGEMTVLTLRLLGRMVTGDVSLKNISGPINIAHYAGQSVSAGLVAFLGFLAIVSISLGIINLLPIPILDGGHLLYFLAEAIKGSPVSERVRMAGQQVGVLALLALMSLALYNDFSRLLG